jgi:pilus assembly protein CpaC
MIRISRHLGSCVRLAAAVAAVALVAPARAQSGAEELRLTVGKSIVIDYPANIRQVSTSNPDVVDANPITVRELLVEGKGIGTSTLIVWNKNGARTFYTIDVEINLEPLRRLIRETLPGEDVQVHSERDSISLTGRVSNKAVADRALALATPFAKTVVNDLEINTPPVDKQILLRVKFAELDRSKERQWGVNLLSTGAGNTPASIGTAGLPITGFTTGSSTTSNSSSSTGTSSGSSTGGTATTSTGPTFSIAQAFQIFAFRPDLNIGALVQALESQNILQILSEPTLVTTNGKEASFLVGGEFPVPVIQGGSNAGAVTVQFKEFGIRLQFTPTITGNNTIKMHLMQEVSSLDYANAVTIGGFRVPATSDKRTETDIELAPGQSFVVSGLLDQRDTDSLQRIPGLSNIPILGSLFKSRDHDQQRQDLVMLVTPEITEPLKPGQAAPIPYFPRKFLEPLPQPKPTSPSSDGAKATTPAATQKSAGGRHWYMPWKSGS